MNLLLATLGDSIWQIGGGIILLIALVLILALRSSEVHLSAWHQWLWTRITLLVCFSLFLVLSAGVVLFHGANAASTVGPAATQPATAPTSSRGDASPQPTAMASPVLLPSPSPSPTPTGGRRAGRASPRPPAIRATSMRLPP